MSLLIVIVNYRTPGLCADCLASLAPQAAELPGTRVLLVDNASGDDSVPALEAEIARRGWQSWVTLIPSPTNRGFAGGNNLALAQLGNFPQASEVLLLNSDTLLRPGALSRAVQIMQSDAAIGILSGLLLSPDGSVQLNARRFPTPSRLAAYSLGLPWSMPRIFAWAELDDEKWDRRTQARDVDWVGGAFMLIRRALIEQVGVLDERFFFYGEDAEFCHRARRRGWRIRYDPSVVITHLGGASSDDTRLKSHARQAMWWQARYLTQRVCFGRGAELFIRAIDIFSFGARYLKFRLRRGKTAPESRELRDILAIQLGRPAPAGRPQ